MQFERMNNSQTTIMQLSYDRYDKFKKDAGIIHSHPFQKYHVYHHSITSWLKVPVFQLQSGLSPTSWLANILFTEILAGDKLPYPRKSTRHQFGNRPTPALSKVPYLCGASSSAKLVLRLCWRTGATLSILGTIRKIK